MSKRTDGETHVLDFERPIVELEDKINELVRFSQDSLSVGHGAGQGVDLAPQIRDMRLKLDDMVREIFAGLTPWQRVQIARHPNRPSFSDMKAAFIDDWLELHGDRAFRDDRAISTAFGRIGGHKVMVVAHRKGRTTKERVACNFGMPNPEGYRKALRKMKIAEKLGLPVVTFINTPGAYPGVGAEERGQAHAIAENLLEMARLRVPIVCVVLSEGGSGGALGIGVGDRVLMLENAYYSVISPEGCAAILWKTAERAPEAADILKITATDLKRFSVIDDIVPEPAGGAHRDARAACGLVRASIVRALDALKGRPIEEVLDARYQKLRAIGAWIESAEPEAFVDEDDDLSEAEAEGDEAFAAPDEAPEAEVDAVAPITAAERDALGRSWR